ncbi:retinol dehydrogenase 14-like [Haliotis rufescens]|uniref:retinol dehydrogenase 14-like n=1 Tax=Haliotis rufescens TaxID=6454 RepID=UPI001EAF95B3|nr:retinol dehydrogenase 14-like [Haliotis rufescens]
MATADGGASFLTRVFDTARGNYIALAGVVSVGIGIALLRQLVSGGVCRSNVRLKGKFAIVTGANTGIGKETAKDLAVRGARVLLACRDPLKGAAAADDIFRTTGQRLMVKTLDLANLDSVRQFAKDINDEEPKLDILVNNAGVMMCPKMLSKQGYELQFATNHLGHFLLTNLLLGLIQRSAPSRIVVVSSGIYKRGDINFDDINSEKEYNPYAAYAQSKVANILFSNELAKKLKGTGVTVNSLHPGVIASDLTRHVEDRVPGVLRFLIKPLYLLVQVLAFKTVKQGAQTSICCAVAEELEGVTGKYFSDCTQTKLLPHATDEDAARRLWRLSEEMTGLVTGADNSGKSSKTKSDRVESNSEDKKTERQETVTKSGSKQTTV